MLLFQNKMSNFLRETRDFIWETIKIVVVSLLIILPIRFFIIQPFFVRGESMAPSFNDKDYLIIDEISYRFNKPQRGEVVVFRFPQEPSQYYIKRIVGLPEETVEIKAGNVIIYNRERPLGFQLKERYLSENTSGEVKIRLDDNEYFVLGDNRGASSDSRRWGPLGQHLIIGRAWFRAWPVSNAGTIESPIY